MVILRSWYNRLLENELVRRVVRNSGYLFGTTGISAGLSVIQGILVARLLGAEGYGILGTVMSFSGVVQKIVSFRMGELVVKYVGHYAETGDRQRASAIFKLALLSEASASLIAFVLIWLLAPIGARVLAKDAAMDQLFMVYGLVILANIVYESTTGLLQIFDRFRTIAGYNLVQSLATLVLVVGLYIIGGGLLEIVLAYVAGKAVGALGLTFRAFQEAKRHWGSEWGKASLSLLRHQARELAHFALSTNISATINLINKDSELLWVSFFRSPAEAGFYKLAINLAAMVEMPVNPLPQATYPELSRQAARQDWNGMRYVLRQGSLLAGGYSLLALLLLTLAGKPLIRLFYTDEFLPAYPALIILTLGYLVANACYWRRVALLALGRPDFPAKLNLVLAVFKVAGILLLVPQFGYLASAWLLTGFYWVGSWVSTIKIHSLLAHRRQTP